MLAWVSGRATKHDHWFNATIIKIQLSIFIIAPINFGVKYEFDRDSAVSPIIEGEMRQQPEQGGRNGLNEFA